MLYPHKLLRERGKLIHVQQTSLDIIVPWRISNLNKTEASKQASNHPIDGSKTERSQNQHDKVYAMTNS